MRKALWVFALLALGTPAFAADQFEGTWNINKQKSTGPEPTTVERLVIIGEGEGQVFTLTGKAADGTPFTNKFSIPAKGGAGKIIGENPFDGVTAKPFTANTQDFLFTANGKPSTHVHSVISSDGKTMTSAVRVMEGGTRQTGRLHGCLAEAITPAIPRREDLNRYG